jgi:hypothetical protein
MFLEVTNLTEAYRGGKMRHLNMRTVARFDLCSISTQTHQRLQKADIRL